jgi:crotonobetaine/carnitine-CoA ligase
MYAGEWVLSAIVDDRARRLGDRTALVSETGRAVSYGELRDDAARVARLLRDLGVEPGDRVATMLPSTYDYVRVWLGSSWAGAVEVPVNTDYKGTFLAHVLEDSGSKVAVVHERFAERFAALGIRDLVVVGVAEAADLDPAPRVPRGDSDLLYILYTSGTTGPSKGVVHVNRSACWPARAWLRQAELTSDDVAYTFLPLSHVTARSAVMTGSLLAGARVAMRERFSASEFWNDVRRHGATCFMYVGAVIHFLLQQEPRPGELDNTLRVGAGAAAGAELSKEFHRRFGCELLETYGMTEIGTAASRRLGDPVRPTMGRPFDDVLQIEIHDAHDRPLGAREHGEIVVRPREPFAIMQGYWGRAEATVAAWRNLWLHTGDLGYWSEEGDLVFVDRLTDSMRRRGENISSFEVERAVHAHPDVEECAAFPVQAGALEDEVMIAVVLRQGRRLDAESLLRFCAETMPRFAVPRFVRFVAELPKTPTGRTRKHVLREAGVTADTADREALGI